MKKLTIDNLQVEIYANRGELGKAAAEAAAARLRELLESQDSVSIVFAAAPSQHEFLDALAAAPGIDWPRVNGFHMDEYRGLGPQHPQRFGLFLKKKIFDRVPIGQVFYLDAEGSDDGEEESRQYAQLLADHPTDITCMGIGENTHLAFNDPHVADFNDPALVKIVDLDSPCKQQQVNDGCFPATGDVPSWAYTLTIPALMRATYVFCMVPGKNKAPAVRRTLTKPISETYPSTALRRHEHAVLFLDEDSSEGIV